MKYITLVEKGDCWPVRDEETKTKRRNMLTLQEENIEVKNNEKQKLSNQLMSV